MKKHFKQENMKQKKHKRSIKNSQSTEILKTKNRIIKKKKKQSKVNLTIIKKNNKDPSSLVLNPINKDPVKIGSKSQTKKKKLHPKYPNKNRETGEDSKQCKKLIQNQKVNKSRLKNKQTTSLRERMLDKLRASRFRYLNEQLYINDGQEAKKIFESDPESFQAYHEGFRQQVSKWPMNPLDKIIESITKMSSNVVVADFGCGEAKLAQSVPQKVHSFDFVKTAPDVIACDMAHCPLSTGSVDIVVFCLSLMGTNLQDYFVEANRIMKINGIMKIAEVESRFEKVDAFIQALQSYGFKISSKNLSNDMFYFMDFKKERNIKKKNKIPAISLKPCLYKKR